MKTKQTNPMGSENPCPIPKPKGTIKTRGVTAYDLLKPGSRFKVKRTQKEIQQANRPQFDHPKILHVLIDRANGFGCKTLAKRHGGSNVQISNFLKAMGFDRIDRESQLLSSGESARKSAQKIYEEEWMKEVRSVKKDRTWANHPAVAAWYSLKKYYADPAAHHEKTMRWRQNNKDKVAAYNKVYSKEYNQKNREKIAVYHKQYRKNNPDKIRENARKQRKKPINRMRSNARKRLRKYLKTPGLDWPGYGCTSDEFRAHMEKQFTDKMTWENYGTYWHDDHIRPMASFDLNDPEQLKQCEHYTNHQPLEAKKNLKKSDNWDGQITMFHEIM